MTTEPPIACTLTEAESRCCAFLRMELHDELDALTLAIDGPPGAERVIGELVAALAR